MIKPTNISTNLKSEMRLEALSLGGIKGFLAAELPSIRARVLDLAGAAAIRQLATSDDIREALRCLAAQLWVEENERKI